MGNADTLFQDSIFIKVEYLVERILWKGRPNYSSFYLNEILPENT